MSSITENYRVVCEKIALAAEGREVKLIPVSKFQPTEAVAELQRIGIKEFGENYPQHITERAQIFPEIAWHMIGQMQSNKVKYLLGHIALLQSLDRMSLAATVERLAGAREMVQDVLVQVNIGHEPQKGGVEPGELEGFLEELVRMPHIRVRGLMTIPPAQEPPEPYFAATRALFDRLAGKDDRVSMEILSMGMSHDYEKAVAMGANMVRVGTAIFGPRPQH